MKKITDTKRLDFIQKRANFSTPGGFFYIGYDGSIGRCDSSDNPDGWDCADKSIRRAIDAAIRQEEAR